MGGSTVDNRVDRATISRRTCRRLTPMKLVRDFERRLERLVDGMAGKVFRGKLQPVELATRLVREADLSVEDSAAGPTVANVYNLRVNPRDLDFAVPPGLVSELEKMLESTAADRGWRLDGPVRVTLEPTETVSPGTVDCRTDRSPGRRPSWADLTSSDGERRELHYNRCIVGRGESSDIAIVDPGVSRTHALLWREGGEAWALDLNSANGTRVDGRSSHAPLVLSDDSIITFGPVGFAFRLGDN